MNKVSASEFTEAIEELATHVADFGINEQDYSILQQGRIVLVVTHDQEFLQRACDRVLRL